MLYFRHLLEKHKLRERLFAAQHEIVEREGPIMCGGSIIAAPSSTKNATGTRDPQMHQTKKATSGTSG
jgi:IS5 family transposase